ncbi:MAG TPA: orotidine-5'-phosphate decarboxylase [Dermatophilaceae bacterium]|nr:orotidine-5'-phosphate decarboxylase [Dermatophilaceae bacterium]
MPTGRLSFGVRLRAAMDEHGPLCAGIDPHRSLVESWGLPYDLAGVERFAMTCVEAFGGALAAVKPQSAFFEVFGSAGVALLERVLGGLRDAGTLTVLDVKRGDIGSTMGAYAEAFLGPDAPGAADAITVSPYLGYGALRPAVDLAAEQGRGVFVLALTSNPEGPAVQHARLDGRSVAGSVVAGAAADNAAAAARGEMGHVGLVVGATVGSAVADLGLDLAGSAAPLLAPGIGAQGATAADVRGVFGAALPQVLAASSRGVLAAGPGAATLRDAARREAEGLRALLAR